MLNGTLPMDENSMVMEIEFEPAKGKTERFHMICTKYEKERMDIRKNEYKAGGF